MPIPQALLDSLQDTTGFQEESFLSIHNQASPPTSIRLNPFKPCPEAWYNEASNEAIPWSAFGHYLPERPIFTFDPLFHAGTYYVQEASSMFVEYILRNTVKLNQDLKVLDLCAAPGAAACSGNAAWPMPVTTSGYAMPVSAVSTGAPMATPMA